MARLHDLWGSDDGAVHQPDNRPQKPSPLRKPHTNWIIRTSGNAVIAVEPSREFDNEFVGGPDPFMEALKYAAEQLRKDDDD